MQNYEINQIDEIINEVKKKRNWKNIRKYGVRKIMSTKQDIQKMR